jgi:hypothetical protein
MGNQVGMTQMSAPVPPATLTVPLRIEIVDCPEPSQLGPVWRDLESRSAPAPFLTWAWIGTLLELSASRFRLARVSLDGRVVGMALLGGGRKLHLNESGDPALDTVWIEYNGVLSEFGFERDAAALLLQELFGSQAALLVSGVENYWREICAERGLVCRLLRYPQPSAFANFGIMGEADPLDFVSRNCREQIRRSMRYFASIGPVTLERAETAETALAWYDELEKLHTTYWHGKGQAGSFITPQFKQFHRRLIATNVESGAVDLLRLRAGDQDLGYLYNLWHGNLVAAYQSGFNYGEDPRWRPGLVAHLMAMRSAKAKGAAIYNFLAGDARYKTSLSSGWDQLNWMVIYRPSITQAVVDGLRRLKQVLLGRPADHQVTARPASDAGSNSVR